MLKNILIEALKKEKSQKVEKANNFIDPGDLAFFEFGKN